MAEPRSFFEQLFSFRGRSGRANFWLTALAGGIVLFVVMIALIAMNPGGIPNMSPASGVILILCWLGYMVVGLFASIRRLHDRDKSGHWLWLFWFLPAVLSGVAHALEQQDLDRLVILVLSVVAFALSLWGGIEIGFLRGTRGPNRFGPDSIAGSRSG